MSHHPRPLGGRLITVPVVICAVLTAIGFFFIGQRLYFGIGAVANVNAGYPWGIWIAIDVMVGTAFGCGGWAMALLTYGLNRAQYHPLIRPALLGGLFGYTFAGMAVMVDLGRYLNSLNLFLPWYANINSIMLETALCVMLYIGVVWTEFSPAFLERFSLHRVGLTLNRFMFVVIALGMLLPTLHQSSLGTILIVNETKLSHLWWTEWLPLLYLSSALAMGYGVVVFESTLVSRAFHLKSELPLLASISRVTFWVTAFFFVVRIGAILVAGDFTLAFQVNMESGLFWAETALFLAALFFMRTDRPSDLTAFLGACALLAGGTLYRIDSYLLAYQGTPGWNYFPSLSEAMITIGLIALEVMAYILFVKLLPVLSNPPVSVSQRTSWTQPVISPMVGAAIDQEVEAPMSALPSTVKSGRAR